ncbi:hypothetical protein ACO0LO_04150 [Undibacterium sp. TJN25]|uniref:hypothetical protein n=1 Tax=Undibacterium sp. TJN25 TaxID=3413056 RepID=UPI003BF1E321
MHLYMEFLGNLPQFHRVEQTAIHLRTGMQVRLHGGGIEQDGETVDAVLLRWPGQPESEAAIVPAEKFLHLHALEAGILDVGSRDHYIGLFNTVRNNVPPIPVTDPIRRVGGNPQEA